MSRERHPLVHGTRHAYLTWACRCPACVEAYRAAARARYVAERQAPRVRVPAAPRVRPTRSCASCDALFLVEPHQQRCPACRRHHGQHAAPATASHAFNTRLLQEQPPPSSWWTEADASSFTATATAEHLTRMRYSRFGQGSGEVMA